MSTHQVPVCHSLFSAYEQYFRVLIIKPNKPMKISSPKLSTNINIGLLRIHICTHLINHYARINTYIKKTPSQILIRTNKEYPDAYIHESYRRKHGNPKSITCSSSWILYSVIGKEQKTHTDEMNLTLYWVVVLDSSTEAQITVLSSSNREENKINK